ncbi:MAG: hypothetical protein RL217_688 [Pseudomonadota bacterium]|jgi:hypothetical protein
MKASLLFMLTLALPVPSELAPATSATEFVATSTSLIRDATFMERSANYTDLYLIKTPNKGRSITVYCNTSYCYRQRAQQFFA